VVLDDGDTLGAHLDRDVHFSISMLRLVIGDVPAGQFDMLVQYVCRVASLIIHLSERVLSQSSVPE
jgi:hypothetical protein